MREGRISIEFKARTKDFAASVIRLYINLSKGSEELRVIGKQLLRSGTSVAAHIREASRARSDAEFISKLGGALQEADESQLWLELLSEECGVEVSKVNPIHQEANELIAIMVVMVSKTRNKS